jgi:hypothetical protein
MLQSNSSHVELRWPHGSRAARLSGRQAPPYCPPTTTLPAVLCSVCVQVGMTGARQ